MSRVFFALDFDRCLGDIDALYNKLLEVADTKGFYERSALLGARKDVEMSGGSFDVLSYLRQKLEPGDYRQLLESYADISGDAPDMFLNPGARRLLDWLNESGMGYGIITYGGQQWQTMKIKRAGLGGIRRLVTDNPHKAHLINSWHSPLAGGYSLPVSLVDNADMYDEVVLVDDKASAFSGLGVTPGTRGYWVQGDIELLPSQVGEVPPNVQALQSLDQIVEYEKSILT